MNNKQQTAVEWLVDNLHYLHSTKWDDIVEQAKEMEKDMHHQQNMLINLLASTDQKVGWLARIKWKTGSLLLNNGKNGKRKTGL